MNNVIQRELDNVDIKCSQGGSQLEQSPPPRVVGGESIFGIMNYRHLSDLMRASLFFNIRIYKEDDYGFNTQLRIMESVFLIKSLGQMMI